MKQIIAKAEELQVELVKVELILADLRNSLQTYADFLQDSIKELEKETQDVTTDL